MIKQIRKSEGLTQTEFANRLEVGRSYIAQLEAGKTTLSERLKDKIKTVFELPADLVIEKNSSVQVNTAIAETLDNYRDSLTNDEFLSDHDYRVTVRVINRIKELLKDF